VNRPAKLFAAIAAIAAITGAVLVVSGLHRQSTAATSAGTNPTMTRAQVQRTDLVASQQVTGTLGYPPGPPITNQLAGTFTAMPDEGTIVEAGQALFDVDTKPVVLLAGAVPAWRAFAAGMTTGPDVAQLQAALARGPDPADSRIRVDGRYGAQTIAAVRRWQQRLGLESTGMIDLGRVVFLPAAVRVGQHSAAVGGRASPGQAPYATTGASQVVTIDLDVARQAGVRLGLPVTVELPSGARTPGRVSFVGRVAQLPASPSSGSRPFITVTVALLDPTSTGSLDQQPVVVDVTTLTRNGVLAVPITALLALREGGFGMEVIDAGGRHQIVAVTPGLFAETLVEINGAGVRAGMTVVTAQ
jgi:peptidoglycan hydrolase-like protein with peptidoglycan-binding domain